MSLSVLALGALFAVSCEEGGGSKSSLSGAINIVGASSQSVAQGIWGNKFQEAHSGVTVNYDPQGSGAGRRNFISGASTLGASDVPFSTKEMEGTFQGCADNTKGIELPVYISPIAVAFNVEGVTDLKLDADTAAAIFKGDITKWNDPKLVALNPGAKLPDANIVAVHRSDDSGTTANFTDYLAKVAPGVWTEKASQTFPYQSGEAAKGSSGVASVLKQTKNTIGYVDASAAKGINLAQLKVGDGFSTLSSAGAALAVEQAKVSGGDTLALELDRKVSVSGAWPITLVSYMLACSHYKDQAQGALAKAYVGYIGSEAGQKDAVSSGLAPLPESLSKKVVDLANKIK